MKKHSKRSQLYAENDWGLPNKPFHSNKLLSNNSNYNYTAEVRPIHFLLLCRVGLPQTKKIIFKLPDYMENFHLVSKSYVFINTKRENKNWKTIAATM